MKCPLGLVRFVVDDWAVHDVQEQADPPMCALWGGGGPWNASSHAGLATVVRSNTSGVEGSSVSEPLRGNCWSDFDNELPGALFHVPELW